MVVLRGTKLTDETHLELARKFGELDDVKPYVSAGRKNRLKYNELFDVSNIWPDGSIVDPNSARGQANKVRDQFLFFYVGGWGLGHRLRPASNVYSTPACFRAMPCFMSIPASILDELDSHCYWHTSSLHRGRGAAPLSQTHALLLTTSTQTPRLI